MIVDSRLHGWFDKAFKGRRRYTRCCTFIWRGIKEKLAKRYLITRGLSAQLDNYRSHNYYGTMRQVA